MKTRRLEPELKQIELDSVFTKFLDAQKPKTRISYSGYFKYWVQYSGMNGKESLEFKRNDKDAETEKKVLGFQQWLKEVKGFSDNSAKTYVGSIRGFYSANRLTLVFNRAEKKHLAEANKVQFDYPFTKEDLAKMLPQANLEESYILVIGKDVGLRASDMLSITFGQLRCLHLDEEPPIPLGEIATKKEKVKAYPFLSSDSIPIVKAMLEKYKDKKDSDTVLDYANEQPLSRTLQRLFNNAHLVSGGKLVRYHCLRKYLIGKISAVASESQWKQIVGKRIQESAYIGQEQLKEIWAKAMPSIILNGHTKNHIELEKLNNQVDALTNALIEKDAVIQALMKRLNAVETQTTKNSEELRSLKETTSK